MNLTPKKKGSLLLMQVKNEENILNDIYKINIYGAKEEIVFTKVFVA